jgi:hypothetical protein
LTEASTSTASVPAKITLVAGIWVGAISGLNSIDGLPDSAVCTGCHQVGGLAQNTADKFPSWRATGHAQIFSQNVDAPGNSWTVTACASCHTVGYDTLASANNNGFDDAVRAANWLQPPGAANVYANMFFDGTTKPVAQLANVQCENCHGPNGSDAHMSALPNAAPSRVSIASEVCGSCHGEPLRHGRYQQWKGSLHANYGGASRGVATVANDIATTGDNRANSCARCHTGQGFLAWVDQSTASDGTTGNMNRLLQGAANNGNGGNATGTELRAMGLTAAEVHPQTCATCHDPHEQGNTSFEPNTATVRVTNNIGMTPGGFAAVGLGRGAVCAACHNSRNGKHDDTVLPTDPSAPNAFGTPHDGPQSDVLLGQNAYFVTPNQRGGHSYITDTCANCHMVLTPPPALLSYNQTGTNHSFKADLTICTNCHGSYDGGSLQSTTTSSLTGLATSIGNAVKANLNNGSTGRVLWVRAQDLATGYYTSAAADTSNVAFDTSVNPVTSVTLISASTLQITVQTAIDTSSNTWYSSATATTGGPMSVQTFNVSVSSLKLDNAGAAGALAFFPGSTGATGSPPGTLYKALWNFSLLTNDQSLGVHNPDFYTAVILATKAAMQNGAT